MGNQKRYEQQKPRREHHLYSNDDWRQTYVSPRRQRQFDQQQQQQPQQRQDFRQQYAPSNPVKQSVRLPQTLMELYGVQRLPFVATVNAQIIEAKLNFTQQSHEPYIEFDVSDSTGKCKAMTSTYLMQWVCSKYGAQINQTMVDSFFNQWGNRHIVIKMELKDKARMVIFHEIKWQ